MARYSTALSHLVLAGTGIYCYLGKETIELSYAQCSFGSIIANSLIGLWRWGNPTYGASSDKFYKFTSLLQDLLALPCLVTTVWLQYNYRHDITYIYTVFTGLPLIAYFFDKNNTKDNLLNTMLGVSCSTLGILSFIHQNYYGVAASLSYAFNHFIIRNKSKTHFDVPSQDLYNYAMCFFVFFSLKTILL